jgi:hypothetical protein
VTQARLLLFGLSAIYLVGVVVQFFLAGLGVFGSGDFDPHRALGFALAVTSLILLVLAFVGRVSHELMALAAILLVLNVAQMFLARVDIDAVAALHVVNALVIAAAAAVLVNRSRQFVTSKMAAP